MRTATGVFLLIALSSSVAFAQTDFRNAKWGMSRAEVIAAEGAPVEQKAEHMLYRDKISGASVGIILTFVEDKLASAAYILTDSYVEPNQYVLLANQWREAITEKYGEKPRAETKWINPLYRDNPEQLGFAIAAGHAVVKNTWETARTIIIEALAGSNFKTTLGITYTSRDLKAALDKQEADKRRKAF